MFSRAESPDQMYKLNVAESLSFFFNWIKKLILANIFFVILLSLIRAATWFHYGDTQGLEGRFIEVLEALLLGLRYDLSLLCVITTLPLFYLFFVTVKRSERSLENYGAIVRPYFLITFFAVSAFLVIDFSFYGHLQAHIGMTWLQSFIQDPHPELSRLWEQTSAAVFVAVAALSLIYIWLSLRISRRIFKAFRLKQSFVQRSAWIYLPSFALALILLFIGAWGTVHQERLLPSEASSSSNSFVNYLAGNSLLFLAQQHEVPKVTDPSHAEPQSYKTIDPNQRYEFLEFNPTKDQQ